MKVVKKNLILITIDCLRADHMSCMGYPKKTTPNIDQLASTGILFTQAISVGPSTPSSFISSFTSTYPLMCGGLLYMTSQRTPIAQVLKKHGYHTAAFHSNPWLSLAYGYQRGFDIFDDNSPKGSYGSQRIKTRGLVKHLIGTNIYNSLCKIYGLCIATNYATAKAVNKKVISWLYNNPPNRSFLWIHYMDVHEPYIPSSRFRLLKRMRILMLHRKVGLSPSSLSQKELNEFIDVYDTKIHYVDRMIGSLLHMLKQRGILDNTYVIVMADHGEQFGEHGRFSHGLDLYDELIHVPLIIGGPGLNSQIINQQCSLLDIAPTILDILKIDKTKAFLGKSLLPLINGKINADVSIAISEEGRTKGGYDPKGPRLYASKRKIAYRTVRYKYIYNENGLDEFYDLQNDPKETKNLVGIEAEKAKEFRSKIIEHIQMEEKSKDIFKKEEIKNKIRKLKKEGKI